MPNPLWPLRRQGPNRWLRWGATVVCLAQFLVIVVVVIKACFETEGGCHWYSFLRTAFVAHKFRSMSLDQAASEIVVLPARKDFDGGTAGLIYQWRRLPFETHMTPRGRVNDTKWCAGRNSQKDEASEGKCVCEGTWGLPSCSLPKHLIKSQDKIQIRSFLKLLDRPRNLICAFGIRFDELELAELRIRSLAPYVDLFVVTRAFVSSPLSSVSLVEVLKKDVLFEKFVSGWLADLQEKIIYVPPRAATNIDQGEASSSVVNNMEGNAAVSRRLAKAIATRVSDFRLDDVIIMARPEGLPSTDAVATVKYHGGFTDVVGAVYSRTAFNFGAALGTVSVVPFAVSFDAFRRRFNYSFPSGIDESSTVLGSAVSPAGWSCKWCLSKDALVNRVKLFTELSVVGHGGRLATLELREMVAAREKVKQIAPSTFLPEYAKSYPGKYGFLLRFSSGSDGPYLWPEPQPV